MSQSDRPSEAESEMNGGLHFPPLLKKNASQEDIVKAVNGLALEMQLTRQAVSEVGGKVERLNILLEKALRAGK